MSLSSLGLVPNCGIDLPSGYGMLVPAEMNFQQKLELLETEIDRNGINEGYLARFINIGSVTKLCTAPHISRVIGHGTYQILSNFIPSIASDAASAAAAMAGDAGATSLAPAPAIASGLSVAGPIIVSTLAYLIDCASTLYYATKQERILNRTSEIGTSLQAIITRAILLDSALLFSGSIYEQMLGNNFVEESAEYLKGIPNQSDQISDQNLSDIKRIFKILQANRSKVACRKDIDKTLPDRLGLTENDREIIEKLRVECNGAKDDEIKKVFKELQEKLNPQEPRQATSDAQATTLDENTTVIGRGS